MRGIDFLSFLTFATSLAIVGCTGTHTELCERGADCRGSSDEDIDACIVELDAREEVASIYGCDDRWYDYTDCLIDYGACSGDELTGCDGPEDAYKSCIDSRERRGVKIKLEAPPAE